jgi:uncharacterized protein (TIGR02001 family)
MKLNKIAIAVGAAVMGLSGMAQAELSANVGATSNYIWRGASQTQDGAAIQGGIDYAHESGFYAGTWASTLGNNNGEELDLYGGFSGEASSIGYDVGVIYYAYPSQNDVNFTEIYGSLSFGPVTGGINYTVDKEGTNKDNDIYYYISASTDLGSGWSVGGTVGHYSFDAAGSTDYSHAQLDVTKSAGDFGDFTLTLSDVFDQDSSGGWDNDLIPVVSWTKSF